MTLKELIEKLEAARVLSGDDAKVCVFPRYEAFHDGNTTPVDRVWTNGDCIWIEYPRR